MGIQLYEKKDDICFLFSLGPLQCCPSLKKGLSLLEYIFFVVVEIFFFFFCINYILKQEPLLETMGY